MAHFMAYLHLAYFTIILTIWWAIETAQYQMNHRMMLKYTQCHIIWQTEWKEVVKGDNICTYNEELQDTPNGTTSSKTINEELQDTPNGTPSIKTINEELQDTTNGTPSSKTINGT